MASIQRISRTISIHNHLQLKRKALHSRMAVQEAVPGFFS